MPLKKVLSDFSRNVFTPLGGKKANHKNSLAYFQSTNSLNLPSKHIYYEPPEDFDWDASLSLLPETNLTAGEVIIHRLPTSPNTKPDIICQKDSPPPFETPPSDTSTTNGHQKDTTKDRPYTQEEFTSAILALSQQELEESSLQEDDGLGESSTVLSSENMGDSGVASILTTTSNGGQSSLIVPEGREECDCERRCSNPKHTHELKNGDYGVSPVMERRNKGVFGRLRNLASRNSFNTSEDGYSHSSDYEDLEDEKKFCREARERSSSSWAGRVRDLHRDVKKKISKLRSSKGIPQDDETAEGTDSAEGIQRGSSAESIPSGSGSSLQPPTPTSSNRSSTSEDHNPYVGTFIGRARALVDCTPSPYDRDGLAFKKGDIIDIIAKHKTGIWVGMTQGKVGHFKFINVEEIVEEKKSKYRHRKIKNEWFTSCKKPETLEELLKQLELEEYTNVLILNGYDELDTFKEIEKEDLDNLGIINPDHCSKLLRAVEMLNGVYQDAEESENCESQVKQSPRDSGCYASHENLIQHDSSPRVLSNGQFTVDLEDQDTSQSESGIQSREGTDSNLIINNLDSESFSNKQNTAPTENTVDSSRDDVSNHNSYNILPNDVDCVRNQRSGSVCEVLVSSTDILIPREQETLSVSYLFSHSGTKSSPGSPRKTRTKHHRNKSHSHRGRDVMSDLTLSSGTRYLKESTYPSNDGYVYGWGNFPKNCSINGKSSRKNIHEYDDVVSDTATEVNESPGRYVYRKVKQRKGSLQTLIHDTRPPSPTLMSKLNKKLVAEKIYLHEEPYTDKTGFCGIPPALVQRYSEETQQNILDVADALDQIRITSLQQQGRRGVPNDFLSDSCTVPVIEPNYTSLRSWLISLGLPMYLESFRTAGITEIRHVVSLTQEDMEQVNIKEPYHRVYLEAAVGALFMRFQRRLQTYSQGH